tara:strand:- start:4293 stop:5090 length:798 start_codon:yes stop_codon:yes gene_type:complete
MKDLYLILILFLIIFNVGCQKEVISKEEVQACQRWIKSWAEDVAIENPKSNSIQLERMYAEIWCGNETVDSTTKVISEDGYKNQVRYVWDDYTFTGAYMPEFRSSMDWIKENSSKDAIITTWWDYGHMVRGIGKRDVIAYNPSQDILTTVASVHAGKKFNTEEAGELSNHEDIINVGLILTTTDPIKAINLMQNYNSQYLLVTNSEYGKSRIIYNISGVEYDIVENIYYVNNKSIMYKILKLQPIVGFEKVYSDAKVVIYKLEKS